MSPAQVDAIRRALPACPPDCEKATALFVVSSNGRRSLHRQPATALRGVWMLWNDGEPIELAASSLIPDALLFPDGRVEATGHRRFVDLASFCRFNRVGTGLEGRAERQTIAVGKS